MSGNKLTMWRIFCKYDRYNYLAGHEDLYKCWFKEELVTIGWPPGHGFSLSGPPSVKERRAWSRIRNCLLEMKEGDYVISALRDSRIGRIGKITSIKINDHEWAPKVPINERIEELRYGEQGRIIHVKWLPVGPTDEDLVVKLPKYRGFTPGEYRPALSKIRSKNLGELESLMEDKDNWVNYKRDR